MLPSCLCGSVSILGKFELLKELRELNERKLYFDPLFLDFSLFFKIDLLDLISLKELLTLFKFSS